jgi:MFS family permease
MLMLDIAVVNTALSHIASDLHSGLSGLQWIVDAYTLALATVVLTAGSLADRLGRRRLFAWGMAIFTLTSLWCAVSTSIGELDPARAVQGIGAEMMFASSLAVLADAFPVAAERAKAFAVYGATIGASFAVGPLVGGALTSYISWRAVFFVNMPIGMLPLELFRRPDFTGAQIAAFAISGSFFAIFLYTTLYVQEILHMSAIEAGLVYLPGTVLIFLVSGASASLQTKVPPSVLVVTGLMLVAAGLGPMLLAGPGSDWTALMPGILVGCVGTGLFNPSVVAIALGSVSEDQSGLAARNERRVPAGRDRRWRRGVRGRRPGRVGARRRLARRLRLGHAHGRDHRRRARRARSRRLRPPVPRRPRLLGQAPGGGSGRRRSALTRAPPARTRRPAPAGLRASGRN